MTPLLIALAFCGWTVVVYLLGTEVGFQKGQEDSTFDTRCSTIDELLDIDEERRRGET